MFNLYIDHFRTEHRLKAINRDPQMSVKSSPEANLPRVVILRDRKKNASMSEPALKDRLDPQPPPQQSPLAPHTIAQQLSDHVTKERREYSRPTSGEQLETRYEMSPTRFEKPRDITSPQERFKSPTLEQDSPDIDDPHPSLARVHSRRRIRQSNPSRSPPPSQVSPPSDQTATMLARAPSRKDRVTKHTHSPTSTPATTHAATRSPSRRHSLHRTRSISPRKPTSAVSSATPVLHSEKGDPVNTVQLRKTSVLPVEKHRRKKKKKSPTLARNQGKADTEDDEDCDTGKGLKVDSIIYCQLLYTPLQLCYRYIINNVN